MSSIDDEAGLNAYRLYCSLKAHYNAKSYSFKQYKKNVNLYSIEALNQRSDRHVFVAMDKYTDEFLIGFFASNFVLCPSAFSMNFVEDPRAARNNHIKHVAYMADMFNRYKAELRKINWNDNDSIYPPIINSLLAGDISPNTVSLHYLCYPDEYHRILNEKKSAYNKSLQAAVLRLIKHAAVLDVGDDALFELKKISQSELE